MRGSGGRSLHIVPTASGRSAQGAADDDEAWSEVLRLAPDADQPGIAQSLEGELNIKLADYASLPQGQLTFALVKNQWMFGKDEQPGLILLIDTRDRSSQLTTNLTNLRKHWVDSGRDYQNREVARV